MDFQQIRDFVNPAVAQATGLQEVDNLQMPVPVAYVPVQIVIDGSLSLTSENPVQNKVIAVAIQNLDGRITAIEGQFSEGVTEAVNNWLDAHPEATTTVQDGAITYAKLDTNLKGEVDQISDLKSAKADKATTPGIIEPEETEADLYVCDPDGNVIAKFVDGHIVTKNFDSSAKQLDLIMEADSDDADLYISDSFGNVIAEFVNGHIRTKNFDSGNIDFSGLETAIEELASDVYEMQKATSGIMYRTKDKTDGVYAACRFHQPNLSNKQFCLLIAGDIHADRTRMQNMIEYLNALDAFDAGIMLGDISGNEYTDTIAFYLDALESVQKPFLTVLGNHDVAGATSDADLYTKFGDCFQYAQLASGEVVSGKCYYHKDFAAQKIRLIVLMQYDLAGRASDTGDLCFGQDQIDWFIGVLNSTPSDYGVIIAEHTNPSRRMNYNMDLSVTSDTWRQSNYAPTLMDGDPVPDIVNAWISGTTLSQTYSYTFSNPPTPLSVSADFTSRGAGEFITYLGGHWHMDVLGAPTAYPNQPDYHTPAAGLSAATQGDIPRKAGTPSEDSLSAIAVDRDKKTVKVFHVGAHFTKDAVDRLYFKYAYGA